MPSRAVAARHKRTQGKERLIELLPGATINDEPIRIEWTMTKRQGMRSMPTGQSSIGAQP